MPKRSTAPPAAQNCLYLACERLLRGSIRLDGVRKTGLLANGREQAFVRFYQECSLAAVQRVALGRCETGFERQQRAASGVECVPATLSSPARLEAHLRCTGATTVDRQRVTSRRGLILRPRGQGL